MGVVAVVPVYRPEATVADLVRALTTQTARVVVVIDGPGAIGADIADAVRGSGAQVVEHDENRGIAAALNTGIEAARGGAEIRAALTVDQDSTVPDGFVDALLEAWDRAALAGVRVGLVAPEHVTGIPGQVSTRHGGVALGRDVVQSGLLVPEATLATVGRFDERLFIDGVDADYALRCLDAGLAVVVADGVSLGHRLGATHEVRVAGRTVALTRSASFRYYYLARNRAVLVRRHARRHPGWAAGQAVGLAGHLVLSFAVVPGRAARARETLHGLRDATRGVTGRRPGDPGTHP